MPQYSPLPNDSLSDVKKSVSDGKSSIASAITAKGVTTAADATFTEMASNINTLNTISNSYTTPYSGTSDLNHSRYFYVNMSSLSSNYKNLVLFSNLFVVIRRGHFGTASWNYPVFSYSYNSDTGVLTIGGGSENYIVDQVSIYY